MPIIVNPITPSRASAGQKTFLELVQRAYQESGLQNTGPASVVGQTGRHADFVRWVVSAHEEIQSLRSHWSWDWASESFDLTAGKDTYDPIADFDIAGGIREFIPTLGASYVYALSQGLNSRQFIGFIDWPEFRALGVPVVAGYPYAFSRDPAGMIRYFPSPNQQLVVVHEYYREPEVLEADADVPRMPGKLHMAIVWKAVMFYADFNKDWSLFKSAEEKYNRVMDVAFSEGTQTVRIAGPMV